MLETNYFEINWYLKNQQPGMQKINHMRKVIWETIA